MATQIELDHMYMEMALSASSISKGVRAKVGACLVTKNGVTVTSCNGLPNNLGNELETSEFHMARFFGDERPQGLVLTTKSTVIHAELNAILKCAKEGVSVVGSTIYTTLSPCEHCASTLVSAGVVRVVYLEKYRCTKGVAVLKQCGVECEEL